jgi:hypothetical protein
LIATWPGIVRVTVSDAATDRRDCTVPGCDHPDGACWRYGDLCAFHGKLVATFDRWINSDEFLEDLERIQRLERIRRRNLDRNARS